MCLTSYADSAESEMKVGNFLNATYIWGDMEEAVLRVTDNVVCAYHYFLSTGIHRSLVTSLIARIVLFTK